MTPKLDPKEFEWIEKAGIENLKARVATADTLAKEAVATLTVLLAGAGGSWAYAVKLLDEEATKGGVAALTAGAWLTFIAALLVYRCMKIAPIPTVYNQPGQLLKRSESGESFEEWQVGELENIEERICRATERNKETARRLNLVRELATLTPIVAGLATLLFSQVH
jgi:hypothetical protein